MPNPPQPEVPPPVALRRMMDGYRVSQSLYVAARLGIADLLKDGPRPYGKLTKAV